MSIALWFLPKFLRTSSCFSKLIRSSAIVACFCLTVACEGPFSALDPAGTHAEEIADLFWWMAGGGLLIWLLVMSLALWAIRTGEHAPEKTKLLIIGGGTVLPFVVLTALLIFGLAKMPGLLELGSPEAPKIRVTGEQWWWRIEVQMPDGRTFQTANELQLPVGKRVTIEVESADVIHSFWIPALSGKVDMIPGRTNSMALEPTRTGKFGGWCAEYCGLSHAQMRLWVQVVTSQEFDDWVDRQMAPTLAASGEQIFEASGCGACHTIRGTQADGTIGPDLTHVGSRSTLGAGIMANNEASYREFVSHVSSLKPGSKMPSFDVLAPDHINALAAYLKERK